MAPTCALACVILFAAAVCESTRIAARDGGSGSVSEARFHPLPALGGSVLRLAPFECSGLMRHLHPADLCPARRPRWAALSGPSSAQAFAPAAFAADFPPALFATDDASRWLERDSSDDEPPPSRPGALDCGVLPSEKIGDGRFGEVWKAQLVAAGSPREVALKVFKCDPAVSSSEAIIRREASLLERLSGGCFPEYYGWLRHNESVALAMELFPGTLREAVVSKPFEDVGLGERVRLFSELVLGLLNLTLQGLIHRDIRVDNLAVGIDEGRMRLKILDLGCMCSTPDGPEEFHLFPEEEPGRCAGTMTYMAPECWAKIFTPAGDMWAAGIVFYQLLFEGRLPQHYYDATESTDNRTEALEKWRQYDIMQDELFLSVRDAAVFSGDGWLAALFSLLGGLLARSPQARISAQTTVDILRSLAMLPSEALDLDAAESLIRRKMIEYPRTRPRQRGSV